MEKFFLKKKSNIKIFDLGNHPFADTFISSKDLSKTEPIYPAAPDSTAPIKYPMKYPDIIVPVAI